MSENSTDNSEYGFPYSEIMQKSLDDSNDANAYGFIPEIPRLFLRSHIFGGSHVREKRKVYVYNKKTNKLENREITTPKLMERLFLEILSNAVDNAFKSQRMGVQCPYLEITMTGDTFSIKSTGIPIPVDIHPYFYNQNQFGTVVELIFGVIGAGGNTNDSVAKQGGGQNGYGAKLVNVFSRYFEVEVGDNIRGFHQKTIWRKNMMEKVSTVITPEYSVTTIPDQNGMFHIYPTGNKYTGENFVKITSKGDFRKFGCPHFTEDELELYMKYAAEASYNAKFVCVFNGVTLDCRSATSLVNIFPKEMSKNSLIHYEFFTPPPLSGKQLDDAIANLQIIPSVELIVIDSPGEGMHISYCNGIYNLEGGEHTDTSYRELLKSVKEIIQSSKGFDKGLDMAKLNITDIKKHCTVIIKYKCIDPVFKGQDKEKLIKPAPKINITIDEVSKIKKWSLVNSIYTTLTGKHLKDINDKNGKSRIKGDFNFEDANWIDTPRQGETVLILCEGNSAGSYILKWILGTPERKDKYAAFLLRGKFKNVTDVGILELESNPEIAKLIKYMGLRYGVDYTTPEGLATLRYGAIYCMVDADSDGSHIQCLILNFLYRLFPTFLLAKRFFYVQTPVIRILKGPGGGTQHIFYNMFDYKKYVESTGGAPHTAKFFKGLASGKDVYAKEDSQMSPIVYTNFDQLANSAFDIAFKKGLTNNRKRWIELWRNKIDYEVVHQLSRENPRYMYINISDYINTKLVEYSVDTFSRALPSYKDGLKKSQRQVLWYILLEWNFGHSRKGEVNIEAIALGAKTKSKYHHGDLTDTLARMGSNYPGSNNIPLMAQEGQFGSRNKLGKDIGASRYVETKPESIISKIFDKELMELIECNIVESKEVEPKWIPSKIPLHIINGVIGLATAYSTEIPSYHPVDVIMWIINYISDKPCFPMIPWFKGFTGKVELEILKNKYKKDKDLVIEGQEMLSYYEGLTLTTTGIYQVVCERDQQYSEVINGKKQKVTHKVKDIFISEIPIGVAIAKYRSVMEEKCDKINDQMATTDTPSMIIEGWKDKVDLKELKLVQRSGMCNITLIDDDSFPIQMRNVYEALKIYCDNMKLLYDKLKKTRLLNLEKEIKDEMKRIKLIELLLNDTIITKKQKESYIAQQLASYDIEYDYYKKLGRRSESEEGYTEHVNKLIDLQKQYTIINEKHYLAEWHQDLIDIMKHFNSLPEYCKLQHHCFPYVETSVDDLLIGKVKSPFAVKEEQLPPSI